MPAISETKITPELVAAHGLKPDEYARILALAGRAPTFTELGIFSAMWNEHCSYKSSPNPEFIDGRDASGARASR